MAEFAITTDYIESKGSAVEYFGPIAAAGWKWIHWCHHWNDDYLYESDEVRQIDALLRNHGLRVLDIHGSTGQETPWDSADEDRRAGGVALVRNRLQMSADLGCGVVIMHPARRTSSELSSDPAWEAIRRSIDALLPDCRRLNVRLAIENMATVDSFDQLDALTSLYPPEQLGICYDTGHGNIAGNGTARLAALLPRLIALHLNDNDAQRDLHQPHFLGTVDWPAVAALIHRSGYDRLAMSVEVVMKHAGADDEAAFLRQTLLAARRFGEWLGR